MEKKGLEAYVKKFTYRANKIFDKEDTAKLKSGKALNEAGEFLQNNPFGLAGGAGLTDMKGDTQKDRVLTTARAMGARDYLVQNFKLDNTRVKPLRLGNSTEGHDGAACE